MCACTYTAGIAGDLTLQTIVFFRKSISCPEQVPPILHMHMIMLTFFNTNTKITEYCELPEISVVNSNRK